LSLPWAGAASHGFPDGLYLKFGRDLPVRDRIHERAR